jgi:hypothetical protein
VADQQTAITGGYMAEAFTEHGGNYLHHRMIDNPDQTACGVGPHFLFSTSEAGVTCPACRKWLDWMALHGPHTSVVKPRPTIVCLCGSTRFRDAFLEAARDETLAGRIVLSVGSFGHVDQRPITDEQKAALDALHLQKIDMAHEILVINPGNYIGESTKREIAHAIRAGKPVRYLVPPASPLDDNHPIIRGVREILRRGMPKVRIPPAVAMVCPTCSKPAELCTTGSQVVERVVTHHSFVLRCHQCRADTFIQVEV